MTAGDGSLARDDATKLIERLASTTELGIFVGAGVSIEAGLPSWNALIKRLLKKIAPETESFRVAAAAGSDKLDQLAAEFAERTLASLGPLAAAAVIKAHFEASYVSKVKEALYEGIDVPAPGPTALAIARFVLGTDASNRPPILTTNFDPLLEMALRRALEREERDPDRVRTVLPDEIGSEPLDPDRFNVVHLHGLVVHPEGQVAHAGLLDRDSQEIVFAEDEFLVPGAKGHAVRDLAEKALDKGPFLFLGAGLTDMNVLGYLYRAESRDRSARHATVAVSQQVATDVDPDAGEAVVEALQQTAAARLRKAQVDVAFVDTYSEASQFMRELSLHRAAKGTGEDGGYDESRHAWRMRSHRFEQRALTVGLLPAKNRDKEFAKLQKRLRPVLDRAVRKLKQRFEEIPAFQTEDEQLALHLWVHAPQDRLLSLVAQSDRRLYKPATLQVAHTVLPTEYLVVESLCNGTVVEARDQGLNSSRWGSMLAIPFLVAEEAESVDGVEASIPAGVMVLASTSCAEEGLSRLRDRPQERSPMIAALSRLGSEIVRHPVEAASDRDLHRPALEHLEEATAVPRHTGKPKSGAQRIGSATQIEGAPPESLGLGHWEKLIPKDIAERLG